MVGINHTINHQANHNRNARIINLLYNCSRSLSSSLKNNRAKHNHIPKMKNQNKSYFALRMNALNHMCCSHIAISNKTAVVTIKYRMN